VSELAVLLVDDDVNLRAWVRRVFEADTVHGLEAGADDYVAKPFGLAVLRSRVRAVLRRAPERPQDAPELRRGSLCVDRRRREVTLDGRPVHLTLSELRIVTR